MEFLFVLLFSVLVAVVYLKARKTRIELKTLSERGVSTTARLLDKQATRGPKGLRRYRFRYTFPLKLGETVEHTAFVSNRLYGRYQTGDSLTVLFLPDNPSVQALEDKVLASVSDFYFK